MSRGLARHSFALIHTQNFSLYIRTGYNVTIHPVPGLRLSYIQSRFVRVATTEFLREAAVTAGRVPPSNAVAGAAPASRVRRMRVEAACSMLLLTN